MRDGSRSKVPGWCAVALLLAGCSGFEDLSRTLTPSPYESYLRSLEQADLTTTRMGQLWVRAGQEAMRSPETLEPPFEEVVYFDPRQPRALAYRLELRRGQRLEVQLGPAVAPAAPVAEPAAGEGGALPAQSPSLDGLFFLDLFEVPADGGAPRPVAEAEEAALAALSYEVERDGSYLLRLQPELLIGGPRRLEVRREGSLAFPVAGRSVRDVGSRFGDPRTGGRLHEGVDVFAPRGTAAVAAAEGVVVRAGENELGGKVVWLRGSGLSFYYAHLDEQKVGLGDSLAVGEVVGLVGNTGNARSTPPHLHFGVYDGGAVDPLPYLRSDGPTPPVTADLDLVGQVGRIAPAQVNLRRGPSTDTAVLCRLPRQTVLSIQAGHAGWYRAEVPAGLCEAGGDAASPGAGSGAGAVAGGYVSASLVEAAAPLRQLELDRDLPLTLEPAAAATAVARLPRGARVAVLGEAAEDLFIRTEDGLEGWISAAR